MTDEISPQEDDLVPVDLPSGATHFVYRKEMHHFSDLVKRYLKDNAATNVTDLQDIDRIIVMETLCWRWGVWLSQRADYWWDPIDESDLSKQLKDTSAELRSLKKSLGFDKLTREKERGVDSLSHFITQLGVRAEQFGIMREEQLDMALELFNELTAKITVCENTTEDEKRELDSLGTPASRDTIYEWIRDVAIPKYQAIDEHFRKRPDGQRSWIREM